MNDFRQEGPPARRSGRAKHRPPVHPSRRPLLLLSFALMVLAAACSPRTPGQSAPAATSDTSAAPDTAGVVSGVGTITYLDLEGGFFGLVADDGTKYDPLDLDEAFAQDGLRVRFRARLRTDVMTIRMWGRPVEILELQRLDHE